MANNEEDIISKLNEVKINQLKLMKARNYQLSSKEEKILTGQSELFFDDLNAHYSKQIKNIEFRTFVYYLYQIEKKAVGIKDIRGIIEAYQGYDKDFTLLIIIPSKISSQAKKEFNELRANSDANFELWTFEQLLINPLEHFLVPKHRILTEEEIFREIPAMTDPKKVRIIQAMLPGLVNDVVARWLGAKVNDIIRIDRYSSLYNDTIPIYRLVRKMDF